jgi:hypothetical protein
MIRKSGYRFSDKIMLNQKFARYPNGLGGIGMNLAPSARDG